MHRSATQKTVALSSCEAELNAAVLCVQDMLYQKNTLESIGLKVEYPMVLEMDNRGAINLINSFSVGGRTRHIDVKQCFLQELKEEKILVVKWIPQRTRQISLPRTLMALSSSAMQIYFSSKDQLTVRGVTLSEGGV